MLTTLQPDITVIFLILGSITAFMINATFLLNFANIKKNILDNECDDECDSEITQSDLIALSRCDKIFWSQLSSNPFAVDLLSKRFEYEKNLSDQEYNRLPFNHKIDWVQLSSNDNAIEIIKNRIEYEKLLGDNYRYQELNYLNCNQGLKEKLNKISWHHMSQNQNAIELLRDRIKYEKSLGQEKYNSLQNRIDWTYSFGGCNKNAVILLRDLLIE
jgi:hypothetical protein